MPDLSPESCELLRGDGDGSAPGPGVDPGAASILAHAAAYRFPDLRFFEGRAKIDALLDYIADTAIARGNLEELRLEAHANLLDLRDRFGRLPAGQQSSKARADEKRRAIAPGLARDIERAHWLVARCTEQINRLDRDYDAASRAYTVLGG